jgi:hypothetical protein
MTDGNLKLEVAALKLARLSTQTTAYSYREIPLNGRMAERAPRHR